MSFAIAMTSELYYGLTQIVERVEFRRWRLSGYGAWLWRMAMAHGYDP